MAVPLGGWGSFKQVKEIVDLAKAQGCEDRRPKAYIMTPYGKMQVRYLYNPKTGGYYDISDYKDDEFMAPSTIAAAERRLGVKLSGP